MDKRERIVTNALSLFDGLIYLDKKLVVSTGSVRLHPSETHMLTCAVAGMSFTEIAARFGITKAAVSRAFARMVDKGLVRVKKDTSRKNRASVALTREGEAVFAQAEALRSRLSAALISRLDSYNEDELGVVERFVGDLDEYMRTSFHTIPDGGGNNG